MSNFQASLYFIKVLNKLNNEDYSDFFPMKKWTGVEIYHIICRFPNATSLEKELDNEEQAEFLKIYNQFANLTTKRVNIVDLPKRKGPKVRTKKVDKGVKKAVNDVFWRFNGSGVRGFMYYGHFLHAQQSPT